MCNFAGMKGIESIKELFEEIRREAASRKEPRVVRLTIWDAYDRLEQRVHYLEFWHYIRLIAVSAVIGALITRILLN